MFSMSASNWASPSPVHIPRQLGEPTLATAPFFTPPTQSANVDLSRANSATPIPWSLSQLSPASTHTISGQEAHRLIGDASHELLMESRNLVYIRTLDENQNLK
ncbi:hypothetical protein NLI96_g13174 [Meripilus lineatus]|uniref:Uncharacterized protein n=1 Tax=Meripilus lineatus TaxID=2056292 RepID=A0AAD5UPW6_9APHY|nr:hypothetical protein NLI96_g13174 [Physisporinus lineatus]